MPIPIEPRARRVLQRALDEAFPDAHIQQGDVEAMAAALHSGKAPLAGEPLPANLAELDLSGCADELDGVVAATIPDDPDGVARSSRDTTEPTRYYWVEAEHARERPDGYQPFIGKLPMVRVTLPDRTPQKFQTAIGTVEPDDHLIATVFEANEKYEPALGYPLSRVDVITPPRQGLRFGAISVFLGYRAGATTPTAYILEAGTATGQPKVLYLGKTMSAKLNQYSGYQPTPFSCSDNAYSGTLTMSGDSPAELHVKARKVIDGRSQPSYMDLTARFSEETGSHVRNVWSGFLIARAAAIVAARAAHGLPKGCEKKPLVT